ncbi:MULTISPECIES: type I toxin-antitoxin system Fst family toxin [Listeria]|nr:MULTISPECIES: type I toxin-antitoxin system Fst family toxin [Listeria]
MAILYTSLIAPIVVGCVITLFKHILEGRRNGN